MRVYLEQIRAALEQMRAYKGRTALTLTGIVLGVLFLNCLLSYFGSVHEFLALTQARAPYRDVVMFTSPGPEAGPGLTVHDAAAIDAAGLGVRATPMYYRGTVRVGAEGRHVDVQASGVDGEYIRDVGLTVQAGRSLAEVDAREARPVAVIGGGAAERLFRGQDPIGRVLHLDDVELTIVGVLAPMTIPFVPASDRTLAQFRNMLYVPASTLAHRTPTAPSTLWLSVQVADPSRVRETREALTALLVRRHRGVMDFGVTSLAEELARSRAMLRGIVDQWYAAVAALAALSMLVGGLGLWSMLMISIQDRVREIGLRKALGATDGQIFTQFLVEALALAGLGSGLGLGAAAAVIALTPGDLLPGLRLHPSGVALSLGLAAFLGCLTGIVPATRAARHSPVVALRAR